MTIDTIREIVIPQEFRVILVGSIVHPKPYTKNAERSSWLDDVKLQQNRNLPMMSIAIC
jgi:hypothetical protein